MSELISTTLRYLGQNIALLITIAFTIGFIERRSLNLSRYSSDLLYGALFSFAAVFSMFTPIEVLSGVIIDCSIIAVAYASVVFGWRVGVLSSILPIAHRIMLGGGGAFAGVGLILSGLVLGIMLNLRRKETQSFLPISYLGSFGLAIGFVTILWSISFTEIVRFDTFKMIFLPILLGYPLAMVLIGSLINIELKRSRMTITLKESEDKYRRVIEESNDLVWKSDLENNFIFVSNNWKEKLGWDASELIEKKSLILMSEKDHSQGRKIKQQIFSSGKPYLGHQTKLVSKDGKQIDVSINIFPVFDHNKQLVALTGVTTDITDHLATLKEQAISKERFKAITENSSDLTLIINRKGLIDYTNPSVSKILGYEISDVIDQRALNFIHPHDKKIMTKMLINASRNSGVVYSLGQVRIKHTNGQWVSFEGMFVDMSNEPSIRGIVVNCRDITKRLEAENRLQEEEQFLSSIIDSTQDGILVVNTQGKVIHTNIRFAEMWRIPEELIMSGNDSKLIAHVIDQLVDPEKFINKVEQLYNSTDIGCDSLAFKDGRNFERYTCPLMKDGELAGRVWSFRDKTEVKRFETMLKSTVEGTSAATGGEFFKCMVKHLAKAIDVQYALVGVINPDGKSVKTLAVWAGDKIVDNVEYDLEGTPCEQVVSRSTCVYPSRVKKWFPEDILLQNMGVESYLGTPIFDNLGKPLGVLVVMDTESVVDSTLEAARSLIEIFAARASAEMERSSAIEALRESEEKYRSYIDSAPDLIMVVDDSCSILDINNATEKATGYTRTELKTMSLKQILISTEERSDEDIMRQIGRGGSTNLEVRLARRNGELLWMLLDWVKMKDGNYLIFCNDITSRKRAEDELTKSEKLESVGLLAGGIAHDFNNLLTGVLGNISLAKTDMDESSIVFTHLEEAERATERAARLTQQLLTFSKGGEPIRKSASVPDIIGDSARFATRGSSARPKFNFANDLMQASIDVGQISQVVHNLVLNAAQAMPDGGNVTISAENVVITPSTSLPLSEGNYIRISVADEGIGIPVDSLPQIFDPYFTTKEGGSGLGLATTYSIIRKHDGHIEVNSEPGKGTVFNIYIPADSTSSSFDSKNKDTACTQQIDNCNEYAGTGRILVMDDEDFIRSLIERILTPVVARVDGVNNGIKAIEYFKRALAEGEPYDLVILDLTIPGGMGGQETISILKEIDPNIKAIVCSGYSNDQVMADHQSFGFAASICKPFKPFEMRSVVKEILSPKENPTEAGHSEPIK